MQPVPGGAGPLPLEPPFSILGRIGGDATEGGAAVADDQPDPFSILGRIGGDATDPGGRRSYGAPSLFQYPRSDRRRCNYVVLGRPAVCRSLLFQYPRSDRRRCNFPAASSHCPDIGAFSILGRIGGDATRRRLRRPGLRRRLSVSSVGSEAMQPTLNC